MKLLLDTHILSGGQINQKKPLPLALSALQDEANELLLRVANIV